VNEEIFDLLEHSDPKVRFQAIKRLAKTKDAAYLDVLAELAETDDDPQVRQIATKAHAYIESGGAASAVKPAPGRVVGITKAEENSAKAYLDEALSHHLNKNRAKAIRSLQRAIATNPALETDAYAISLIESITGLSGAEAMDLVLDAKRHKEIAKEEVRSAKAKLRDSHIEEANKFTWGTISLDLVIYTLIIGIATFVFLLIIGQTLEALAVQIEAIPAASYAQFEREYGVEVQVPDIRGFMEILTPLVMLVISVAMALISLVSLLFWFVGIHFVAKLFGGVGTIQYLIYNVTSYFNVRLPIVFLLVLIAINFLPDPEINIVGFILLGIVTLFNFRILSVTYGRIAKTYNISPISGCLVNSIVSIVLVIILTLLQMAFTAGFINLLESFAL
jgi:hypothetical protein